jgi:hypothetical protein
VPVENLSKQGLYFISDSRFTVGSAVEVTMRLPSDTEGDFRDVHLLVRVVRVDNRNDSRFGIAAQMLRCRSVPRRSCGGTIQQISTTHT